MLYWVRTAPNFFANMVGGPPSPPPPPFFFIRLFFGPNRNGTILTKNGCFKKLRKEGFFLMEKRPPKFAKIVIKLRGFSKRLWFSVLRLGGGSWDYFFPFRLHGPYLFLARPLPPWSPLCFPVECPPPFFFFGWFFFLFAFCWIVRAQIFQFQSGFFSPPAPCFLLGVRPPGSGFFPCFFWPLSFCF